MQHDYDINSADAISGLQFRQDLNACLAAIKSGNSGATAPAAPVAGMTWFDTSTTPAVLKYRNLANTLWIPIYVENTLGANVLSATTTTIGAQTQGDTIYITGNNTITSFDISNTGTKRTLVFTGTPSITHNGTSLILPLAENLAINVGDILEVLCVDGALGYWVTINYFSANPKATTQAYTDSSKLVATTAFATPRTGTTGATILPSGTTAQRPTLSASDRATRYNTTIDGKEYWNGTTWITEIVAADVTSKLPLAGGTMTGAITAIRETKVAMVANDVDLSAGNLFTKTFTATTFTMTVSNTLSSGNANSFILECTNAGLAIITWFSGIKWAGGTAPTLTSSGVDILGFYSHDGGTTWRGIVLAKDSK